MSEVRLGDRVKDKITGAVGIVWGITSYLHGCDRINVMPEELQDGKAPEVLSFDEPQVTVIKARAYQLEHPEPKPEKKTKAPGGPAYLKFDKPNHVSKK